MTNYQTAKQSLKMVATEMKKKTDDVPMINQILNDSADSICKNLNLSEYHRSLLANYVCKLHS